MRATWITLVALPLLAAVGIGAGVTLAWDPYDTNALDIVGFNIYSGTSSRNYNQVTFVPGRLTTTGEVQVVSGAFYFFSIAATNEIGMESALSAEVVAPVHPPAPTVRGTNVVLLIPRLETSSNLVEWSPMPGQPMVIVATNAAEFFRANGLKIQGPLIQQ
jgi:hypothetical protein